MARRFNARIEGGKRLRNFVKNMPEEARAELYDVIKSNLEAVIVDAKSRVPVDTGALRDAMKVRVGKKTLRGRAGVIGDRGYIRLKKGGKRFYAKFVEYGTRRTPAKPFLFPAWRSRRLKTRMAIVNGLHTAIQKANRR